MILLNEVTSGVIAALITAIVGLIWHVSNQNSQNTLKYITGERKSWRETIRDIILRLDSANSDNISPVLSELKGRINTFGKFDKGNYLHDNHIWEEIECIEKCSDDKLDEHKGKLGMYLSALIKYDWERAKFEAKKTATDAVSVMFLFLAIGVLFFWMLSGSTENVIDGITKMIPYATCFVAVYFVACISLRQKSRELDGREAMKTSKLSTFSDVAGAENEDESKSRELGQIEDDLKRVLDNIKKIKNTDKQEEEITAMTVYQKSDRFFEKVKAYFIRHKKGVITAAAVILIVAVVFVVLYFFSLPVCAVVLLFAAVYVPFKRYESKKHLIDAYYSCIEKIREEVTDNETKK